MSNDIYTENFGDIMSCARERDLALQLLQTWNTDGLPAGFYESGIRLAFNRNSGYVFLVNDDYQIAMMNGDKLDIWHSLPFSGEEGFLEDFEDRFNDLYEEDREYLRAQGLDIKESEAAE